MPTAALTYTRPALYPKQSEAFFHGQRYGLTEASTKAGKTVAAIAWILECAFAGHKGQNFWWVAPVSDQAKIAYTRIKNGLTHGTFKAVESPPPRSSSSTAQNFGSSPPITQTPSMVRMFSPRSWTKPHGARRSPGTPYGPP